MKNTFRMAAITLCVLISSLAKSQVTVAEPEFENTIIFVSKENKTTTLERQKSQNKVTTSASSLIIGVGKSKSIDFVEGEKSSVRIAKSDTIKLIARVKNNNENPMDVITLIKFKTNPKKNIRYIELAETGTLKGPEIKEADIIIFTAQKFGETSYLIVASNLDPGEYFLTLKDAKATFQMFGVD